MGKPEINIRKEYWLLQRSSFGQKRRGDIIAFGRNGTSGHVGIVSVGGKYVSAGNDRIVEKSIPKNNPSIVRTTVWRYTC